MGRDLSYWDDEMYGFVTPSKPKKHKSEYSSKFKNDDNDDNVDERLPLSQEYLDRMADILQQFLQLVGTYFIYPELSQDDYKAAKKEIKRAVHHMRKGNTSDFDYDRTMEAITNEDIPEKYIDGGY